MDMVADNSVHVTTVREADFADAYAIYDILLLALEETHADYPAPQMPYALQHLLALIGHGTVAVAEHNGDVVGTIVLDARTWPWVHPGSVEAHYLQNDHFYILPQRRSFGTARKLLDWAKKLADRRGMRLVIELSSGGPDTESLDTFVRRQGFAYMGGKFVRHPIPSSESP